MCLFAGSHLSSVCSKLQVSLIVCLFEALQMSKCLPLITFATLDPQTWQQMSRCPSVQVYCPFPTQDHQTGKKHPCPETTTFSFLSSSLSSFSSSWKAYSSIRNHHYCGFYQRDSLIVGVVSTLQALSFDSHPFKP